KKNEFRAVTKHIKDLMLKEIKAELDNVHSTSAPAFTTVYNWVNEFKRGSTSICDALRSRHLIEIATPEIIDKVHWKKLSARWVPRLLTFEEDEDREVGRKDDGHSFLGCQTINGDYYAALLDRFNNILKKKRPHLAKKKVLFHQDNAGVHTCPAPMTKFNEFCYELLPHPAYSPDLIPDYFQT
ncbi:SETMR methyltransferase, partial [Acromyrmex heyeri]